MQAFADVDDILLFAIEKEREAQQFYAALAREMPRPHLRELFLEFAAQEKRHEEKLAEVKLGGALVPAAARVPDLKIADYLVEMIPSPGMGFQEALTVAMQRERAAFNLYSDLAKLSPEPRIKDLFLALAQEEARHKLALEREYDDKVLVEN